MIALMLLSLGACKEKHVQPFEAVRVGMSRHDAERIVGVSLYNTTNEDGSVTRNYIWDFPIKRSDRRPGATVVYSNDVVVAKYPVM